MIDSVELGTVARVVDCEHRTAPRADPGSEYGYSIGTRDIKGGRIDYAAAKKVDADTYEGWTRRAVPSAGDLILAREAPVGEAGYIDGSRPICLGQRTVMIRLDQSRAHPRFVHFQLLAPDAQEWMAAHCEGSTVVHLNVSDVRRIPLNLPPLDEQRRIAGVLGALDDLIDLDRRLAVECSNLAQALWEDTVAGHQPTRLVANSATVVLGGTPARNRPEFWGGNIPWLNSGRANDFRVTQASELITESGLEKSSTKMMPIGSTIVAITGATLGQVSRIEIAAGGNQSLVGVYAADRAINDHLYFAIRDQVDVLVRSATGGAQQHINKANVEELLVKWPSDEQVRGWHSVAEPLMEATADLLREADELEKTRDELLPLLMSGAVRVGPEGAAA